MNSNLPKMICLLLYLLRSSTDIQALEQPSAIGLALTFNGPAYEGGQTHGAIGGKIGIGKSTLTREDSLLENENFDHIHVTKGTQWPVDLFGVFTQASDRSCHGGSYGLALTLFQQFRLPAIGLRYTRGRILSPEFRQFQVESIALSVSYSPIRHISMHLSAGEIQYQIEKGKSKITEFQLNADSGDFEDDKLFSQEQYLEAAISLNLPPPYVSINFAVTSHQDVINKVSLILALGI